MNSEQKIIKDTLDILKSISTVAINKSKRPYDNKPNNADDSSLRVTSL